MIDPRETLRSLEQRARRRFGQHFLSREDVITRIVRGSGVTAGAHVLEIGPGLGVLTEALLEAGAQVTAVEVDRDLAAWIRERFPAVRLVEGDATRLDLPSLVPPGAHIVANLPYNVGTGLVVDALDAKFSSITVMLQREVVARMLAGPDDDAYGSLSVRVRSRAEGMYLFTVPPSAFHPPPKVDSAVVKLIPRAAPEVGPAGPAAFDATVRAAFAQRRKTLLNSLSSAFPRDQVAAALETSAVSPQARAETLDLGAFQRLAAALHPSASAAR